MKQDVVGILRSIHAAPLSIAVIGGGMAGLACAHKLTAQRCAVAVFDEGREPGGRMATRRIDGYQFDHGAQYFSVRTPRFRHAVDTWRTNGLVTEWSGRVCVVENGIVSASDKETKRYVGVPGMSAIARRLALDCNLRSAVRVAHVRRHGQQWRLVATTGEDLGGFDVVVVAVPAPQAVELLNEVKSLTPRVASVRMSGCWAVMLGFSQPLALPFDGALKDKLTVARLRSRACSGTLAALFQRPDMTSLRMLQTNGFSDAMINRFFSPFFGGVFLDDELQTSSRRLEFVFRMFALGQTALPAKGMGEIPQQLASSLPPESVRLHTRVAAVDDKQVTLISGERLPARAVVVATEGPGAAQLLGESMNSRSRSVTCVYFAAEQSPVEEPILFLNGDGRGVVNDFCAPSVVAPTYAPPGAALLSATVLGDPPYDDQRLETAVRDQLSSWFGTEVGRWRHLRTYRIAHALPDQTPPALAIPERPVQIRRGLFVCGDHRDNASINGAMVSGRRAAEAVLAEL